MHIDLLGISVLDDIKENDGDMALSIENVPQHIEIESICSSNSEDFVLRDAQEDVFTRLLELCSLGSPVSRRVSPIFLVSHPCGSGKPYYPVLIAFDSML